MLARMRRLLWLVLLLTSFAAAQTAAQPQSQPASQAVASAQAQSAAQTAAPSQPQFFHITPVRPVEELRQEALKAQPPVEHGDFLKPDLVELIKLDSTIKLDIRYATSRNFLSTPVYEEGRAFMQRPAAEAVARANQKLRAKGFGLMIYDAYRPWYVTKIFWDATPPKDHKFVADPSEGSRHNRGCAVDLTLYDLKTGEAVPMTGLYDEMSERSYPNYAGGTDEERRNRETLRAAMEAEGFTVYDYEWWHFDYKDYKKYPILNWKFDEIGQEGAPIKVYRIQGDVKPPIPLNNKQTKIDLLTKNPGKATVEIIIDENGEIARARVIRSTNAAINQQALDAVNGARFKPATKKGVPVPVVMNIEVNFHND
jgi:zinc D-Ala-D-Ala dipeptidase